MRKDLKKVDLKVDSLEGLSYSWKVPLKTAEPTGERSNGNERPRFFEN